MVWHSDKYCLSMKVSSTLESVLFLNQTRFNRYFLFDRLTGFHIERFKYRRLEKDHWSRSRKADKDTNPNFMRWMTDIKQPALQRHLAGVTPRSNVLRMCERVGQISGPTLKCIWHNFFFCWLIRKIFHSDEEWHLFYCNSILRCRVIQGFVSCDLDDLWYHKWTKKWSTNNETWNICVNTESTGL